MKRVMIIGQPGSGKSWLAREMGRITGLPVHHMDHIHWRSGWVERDPEEKTAMARAVHAQEQWIFEGGHSRTWDDRVARADTCIWLDFPLWFRSWQVFRRTLQHYGRTRPDLPEGCPEQFSWEFYKWIWDTRNTGRNKPTAIFKAAPPHLTLVRLTSRRAVSDYTGRLEAGLPAAAPLDQLT